jgi:hypothetical protein
MSLSPSNFQFTIPTPSGGYTIDTPANGSIVFVGANGAGKSRLGAYLELEIGRNAQVHRVGAHRSLELPDTFSVNSYENAENQVLAGTPGHNFQASFDQKWRHNPATKLVSDFQNVVQAMLADKARTAEAFSERHRIDPTSTQVDSKCDVLVRTWERLLPDLKLIIGNGKVTVRAPDGATYSADQLSQGERVMFYLLGQCLIARPDSVIIVDEPELHIHKAILLQFWDLIETYRKDCIFLYLTHDLEFAASRRGATKVAIRQFINTTVKVPKRADQVVSQWELEALPADTEFPEIVVSRILGSRRRILFTEGDVDGLDASICRRVYAQFTVVPIGSCEHVIHSVTSFNNHSTLHRIGCAGVIDADDRKVDETVDLAKRGIHSLPVSEVENLLLLPDVVIALAVLLGCSASEAQQRLQAIQAMVFATAQRGTTRFAVDYARRRIDREMKKIGLNAIDAPMLDSQFRSSIASINVTPTVADAQNKLTTAITQQNYVGVLALYDDKGLLAQAAPIYGLKNRSALEQLVARYLSSDKGVDLRTALIAAMPQIP